MKKTKIFLTAIMAVSIALSSCTKEGATGPQGANGVANI